MIRVCIYLTRLGQPILIAQEPGRRCRKIPGLTLATTFLSPSLKEAQQAVTRSAGLTTINLIGRDVPEDSPAETGVIGETTTSAT